MDIEIRKVDNSCPSVHNDMTSASDSKYYIDVEKYLCPFYRSLKKNPAKCKTIQDETPQNKTPQNETIQDETIQNETPQNETPQNETIQNETIQNETPQNETIQDVLNKMKEAMKPKENFIDLNNITDQKKKDYKKVIDLNCGFTYLNNHADMPTSENGKMNTIMHLARVSESAVTVMSLFTDKYTQSIHRYSYGFDIDKNKFTYDPQVENEYTNTNTNMPKYQGVFQSVHIEGKGLNIKKNAGLAILHTASKFRITPNMKSVAEMTEGDDTEYDIRYFSILYKEDNSNSIVNQNTYFIKSKLVKKIQLKHDSTHLVGSVYLCEFKTSSSSLTNFTPEHVKPCCKSSNDQNETPNDNNCQPPTNFILQLHGGERLFLKNPLNTNKNPHENLCEENIKPTASGGKRTIKRKKIYRKKNNKKTNNRQTKKYRKVTKRIMRKKAIK